MTYPVIAIDGPSASGKGTVASRVAAALGWAYLDSGALYRLTALYAEQQGVAWDNEVEVASLAQSLPVRFADGEIYLQNKAVSALIRTEHIGMGASQVAALPQVRAALLQRQRDFSAHSPLVADGRDMASVVFPHAVLKIFLTASVQVRATRRALQLNLQPEGVAFEQILRDIEARDTADRNRAIAPLQQAADATLLDTSDLSIEQSVKKVIDCYRQIGN